MERIVDHMQGGLHCNDVFASKSLNTWKPRQDGRHVAEDIFKCIFLFENLWISIKVSLKLVPKGPINNIPALVQIMAWRRPGDKPWSEPMMVSLLTHIYVTRPQWVKYITDYTALALCHLANLLFSQGILPNEFNIANVFPIYNAKNAILVATIETSHCNQHFPAT